ncbi:hypothetical protein BDV06DRAFT_192897 [Aspergillus oleicola]
MFLLYLYKFEFGIRRLTGTSLPDRLRKGYEFPSSLPRIHSTVSIVVLRPGSGVAFLWLVSLGGVNVLSGGLGKLAVADGLCLPVLSLYATGFFRV